MRAAPESWFRAPGRPPRRPPGEAIRRRLADERRTSHDPPPRDRAARRPAQLLGVDGEDEFTVYLAPVGKVSV